jgi:hypothetical protein
MPRLAGKVVSRRRPVNSAIEGVVVGEQGLQRPRKDWNRRQQQSVEAPQAGGQHPREVSTYSERVDVIGGTLSAPKLDPAPHALIHARTVRGQQPAVGRMGLRRDDAAVAGQVWEHPEGVDVDFDQFCPCRREAPKRLLE